MTDATLTDGLLITSTLFGPVLAVQAQKWVERATEKRRRKLGVFYALMATRAARVSPDHVRALNQIDIEFSGARFLSFVHWQNPKEQCITDAWRIYSDHLNQKFEENSEEIRQWIQKGDELFTDLLYSLSRYFKFDFDKVQLRRGVYSPRAHNDAENRQLLIQANLAKLLAGDLPLKMNVVGFPVAQDALDRQQALQEALINALAPNSGIPVRVQPEAR